MNRICKFEVKEFVGLSLAIFKGSCSRLTNRIVFVVWNYILVGLVEVYLPGKCDIIMLVRCI